MPENAVVGLRPLQLLVALDRSFSSLQLASCRN
jgi:hypothetical protein